MNKKKTPQQEHDEQIAWQKKVIREEAREVDRDEGN